MAFDLPLSNSYSAATEVLPEGHLPKGLGQHFLTNKQAIRKVLYLFENPENNMVIEIGAGTGALTIPLARTGQRVVAIEKDACLARRLQRKVERFSNVRVVSEDFLETHLPRTPFRTLSNIPFSITTPILDRLLCPSMVFQGGVVFCQIEAARRFTQRATKDLRIISWRVWFDLEVAYVFGPESFSPPPKVDVAILRITRREPPLVPVHERGRFLGLVSLGLKCPNLQVRQALRDVFTAEQITRLTRRFSISSDAPVSSLAPHEWAIAFETMKKFVDRWRWPKAVKTKATYSAEPHP